MPSHTPSHAFPCLPTPLPEVCQQSSPVFPTVFPTRCRPWEGGSARAWQTSGRFLADPPEGTFRWQTDFINPTILLIPFRGYYDFSGGGRGSADPSRQPEKKSRWDTDLVSPRRGGWVGLAAAGWTARGWISRHHGPAPTPKLEQVLRSGEEEGEAGEEEEEEGGEGEAGEEETNTPFRSGP